MAEHFAQGGHLPHNRADGRPADPRGLPRQRSGKTPQMHGRYPDYDVLLNAGHWDEVTRELILRRAGPPPAQQFFTAAEAACLGAFLDVVLAQDAEPRIPVLAMVDQKLHLGKLDGFRYADMPEDPETWRCVAAGLDASARLAEGTDFAEASDAAQQRLVQRFSEGELDGEAWDQLDVSRAWSVVMRGALSEFYSHPWAWNEIGFGGPAYPRGYMRLGAGAKGAEPTEGHEAFTVDPVADVPSRGLQ